MTIDRAARAPQARAFETYADEYDRYRPGYPDRLFEMIVGQLALPLPPLVVDLGAGTGRASLAMAALGWRVTAVEPGRAMLDILRAQAANEGLLVSTVQATAESTGLDPGSADLATAAQAFHWFDKEAALAEMARIVRPGGGVALFWNVRDEARSPFVAEYHRLLARRFGEADTGRYLQAGRASGREATRAALERTGGFEAPELLEVPHATSMTAAGFMGMAFTASYVRAQSAEEQDRFRMEIGALLGRHGHTDETPFEIPYRIDLWIARRVSS
ncbi:MAG TPA: class I SAM-dependent methyltransferase [Candidatus Limnocylindria bacterium]|nr:class I SAM-dependent methyltransferase [Candidatus Limnocylindria bacterium]